MKFVNIIPSVSRRKIFKDTFDRANTAGSLGVSSDGSLWSAIRGTFTVSTNKAVSVDAASSYPAATVDMNTQNVSISIKGSTQGSTAALWVTDSGNWFGVGVDQTMVAASTLSAEERRQTALMRIDGYNVFLAQPQACSSLVLPTESLITEASMRPQLGEAITLTKTSQYTNQYLLQGWAFPESWGTWSDGPQATITLPLPQVSTTVPTSAPAKTLTLNARAFIHSKHPTQRVTVTLNGHTESTQTYTLAQESNQIRIPLPANAINALGQKTITITLGFPDKITPKSLGLSDDVRQLAIGIESARFD